MCSTLKNLTLSLKEQSGEVLPALIYQIQYIRVQIAIIMYMYVLNKSITCMFPRCYTCWSWFEGYSLVHNGRTHQNSYQNSGIYIPSSPPKPSSFRGMNNDKRCMFPCYILQWNSRTRRLY